MAFFWRRSGPLRTVERYCAASNANDIAAISDLMAEDFRVIDSSCELILGREKVLQAMRRLIAVAPTSAWQSFSPVGTPYLTRILIPDLFPNLRPKRRGSRLN